MGNSATTLHNITVVNRELGLAYPLNTCSNAVVVARILPDGDTQHYLICNSTQIAALAPGSGDAFKSLLKDLKICQYNNIVYGVVRTIALDSDSYGTFFQLLVCVFRYLNDRNVLLDEVTASLLADSVALGFPLSGIRELCRRECDHCRNVAVRLNFQWLRYSVLSTRLPVAQRHKLASAVYNTLAGICAPSQFLRTHEDAVKKALNIEWVLFANDVVQGNTGSHCIVGDAPCATTEGAGAAEA